MQLPSFFLLYPQSSTLFSISSTSPLLPAPSQSLQQKTLFGPPDIQSSLSLALLPSLPLTSSPREIFKKTIKRENSGESGRR
ncbi:hypothetical protein E2C01_091312 [Portunus trituberculatus]|uniref:Uncharacterized protein n=1 Tax=Portunus trituberculatus TaxID=210409 RepID=A0A5B7JN85_PORTR|nr:hypothetical protein [Portunus trituberculatus]